MLEYSAFKSLRLPVSRENREHITDVIAQLYKDKLQSEKREMHMKELIWEYCGS